MDRTTTHNHPKTTHNHRTTTHDHDRETSGTIVSYHLGQRAMSYDGYPMSYDGPAMSYDYNGNTFYIVDYVVQHIAT